MTKTKKSRDRKGFVERLLSSRPSDAASQVLGHRDRALVVKDLERRRAREDRHAFWLASLLHEIRTVPAVSEDAQ